MNFDFSSEKLAFPLFGLVDKDHCRNWYMYTSVHATILLLQRDKIIRVSQSSRGNNNISAERTQSIAVKVHLDFINFHNLWHR